MGFDTI